MNNENEYYVSRVSKKKHNEYCRRYYQKTKEARHQKYMEFREKQKEWYAKRKDNPQYPIPYKYLTQKDKQLYNKQKAQEWKKVKTEDNALAGDNKEDMNKIEVSQVDNKHNKKGLFSIFKK